MSKNKQIEALKEKLMNYDLNKLSKKELIQILKCYNTYIIAFEEDRWDSDAYPVCLEEFLDNEYQYMLNDGFTNYSEWLDYLREEGK